jgi:hypothetical protein
MNWQALNSKHCVHTTLHIARALGATYTSIHGQRWRDKHLNKYRTHIETVHGELCTSLHSSSLPEPTQVSLRWVLLRVWSQRTYDHCPCRHNTWNTESALHQARSCLRMCSRLRYVIVVVHDNWTWLPVCMNNEYTVVHARETSPITECQLRSFRCAQVILPQVHLRKPCYDFS